jgi:rod shape-determining protein MreC
MRIEKKNLSKFIGGFLLVVAIIFLNSRGFLDPLKYFMANTATLGSGSVRSKTNDLGSFLKTFFSLGKIKKENEKLGELELKLLVSEQEKKQFEAENVELRKQFELLPKSNFKLIAAEVVAQGANSSQEFVLINKGEKDGVEKGMPVIIYDKVLVGEVYEVQSKKSKILLSVSPLSTLGASPAKDKVVGVAKGKYNLEIMLDLIPNQTELNPEEVIITSGKNQKYPEGLLVGKIIKVGHSADGLFKQAVVKPFYSANDLEFVFLIAK